MSKKFSWLTVLTLVSILPIQVWANVERKDSEAFSLQDGQYAMEATFKFSDADKPVVGVGGDVSVTIKGSDIAIKAPVFTAPIVAKLSGNKFKGRLKTNGADVEFQGEIVEKDHVEGVFTGSMGKRKVNRIWTMKLSKKDNSKEKVS